MLAHAEESEPTDPTQEVYCLSLLGPQDRSALRMTAPVLKKVASLLRFDPDVPNPEALGPWPRSSHPAVQYLKTRTLRSKTKCSSDILFPSDAERIERHRQSAAATHVFRADTHTFEERP